MVYDVSLTCFAFDFPFLASDCWTLLFFVQERHKSFIDAHYDKTKPNFRIQTNLWHPVRLGNLSNAWQRCIASNPLPSCNATNALLTRIDACKCMTSSPVTGGPGRQWTMGVSFFSSFGFCWSDWKRHNVFGRCSRTTCGYDVTTKTNRRLFMATSNNKQKLVKKTLLIPLGRNPSFQKQLLRSFQFICCSIANFGGYVTMAVIW